MSEEEIRELIVAELKKIRIVAGYPRNEYGSHTKVIDVSLQYEGEEISKTEVPYSEGESRSIF